MEFGNRLGFALETRRTLGLRRQKRMQELERDEPIETRILGFIDDCHASASEFVDDVIALGYDFSVERCQFDILRVFMN